MTPLAALTFLDRLSVVAIFLIGFALYEIACFFERHITRRRAAERLADFEADHHRPQVGVTPLAGDPRNTRSAGAKTARGISSRGRGPRQGFPLSRNDRGRRR